MRLFTSILFFVALFQVPVQSQIRPEKLKRADSFFGVHFDLHASEDITDAGRTLSSEMVDTFLKRVNPDFIQIDCKGHPGISSYPTEVGYHVKGFEKDPLKLYREVTDRNKVALYMHFSGVWDGKVVKEHPDWAVIKSNGERSTQKVSFFSPYLDTYMIPQLKELSGKYKVDGAWIDGECWAVEPDFGEASLKRFTAETGITSIPHNPSDKYYPEFIEYTRSLFREHLKKYIDAIHKYNPDFQITSNWSYSSLMPEKVEADVDFLSGDVTPQNGVYRSAFEARCLAPQGKPWDLMAWGFSWDGGEMPMSIKSAIQLEQEAAEIIAMGGGVQFYFQQNRDLSIKPWLAPILEDIGKFCRQRQPFCHKAEAVPQVALIYPSEYYQRISPVPYSGSTAKLQGALYACLDGQYSVEVLMEHNLSGRMNSYPLIILPECNLLAPSFIDELRNYVKDGGNLIVIGAETAEMFKDDLGVKFGKVIPASETFISSGGRIGAIRSEVYKVDLSDTAKPISWFLTGSDFRSISPEVAASVRNIGKGKIAGIYFNAGESYSKYKTFVIRDFLSEIIEKMFPGQIAKVSGSHFIHVAVNRLNNKLYVNLINIAGDHDGLNTIGFDEIPQLTSITVSVKSDKKPGKIILQPEGREMNFTYSDGRSRVVIPELKIHSILEVY